jgi:predicted MFS family arabinose efflux permease
VIGGLAADLWGYPAALSIGAGAVLLGLSIFVVTRTRARAASPAADTR